jgi:nicotinamide-nucleotide amidase
MATERDMIEAAEELHEFLKKHDLKIVLTESCTGGQASAAVASIPGASEVLCGSFVTYAESTKIDWLGVDEKAVHENAAVNAQVATEMAWRALQITDEADLAASVTGFLSDGPKGQTGRTFMAMAMRQEGWKKLVGASPTESEISVYVTEHQLDAKKSKDARRKSQLEASQSLLLMVRSLLEDAVRSMSGSKKPRKKAEKPAPAVRSNVLRTQVRAPKPRRK